MNNLKVTIVSQDKDLMQLVNSSIRLYELNNRKFIGKKIFI